MFKCKKKTESKCIHVDDLCNGVVDCPLKDDEFLCQLKNKHCALFCMCLNLTISCTHLFFSGQVPWNQSPFLSFHLSGTSVSTASFLNILNNLYVAYLGQNNLKIICIFHSAFSQLVMFTLVSSLVSRIESNCFQHFQSTRILVLRQNRINLLQIDAFSSLCKLEVIDIAFNLMTVVKKSSLNELPMLKKIPLKGNLLEYFDSNIFGDIIPQVIETDFYQICCVKPPLSFCNGTMPPYNSCVDILPKKAMEIAIFLTSWFIFLLNTLCIFFCSEETGFENLHALLHHGFIHCLY